MEDTASEQNLPTSCPHSGSMHRDDDIKTSEPVAEGTESIPNAGTQTVENTASSDLNSNDQNTTITTTTTEIDSLITTNVTPYNEQSTNPLESQINSATTDNSQQKAAKEDKHIMISYNRATATPICQRIYDLLTDRKYRVWFDRKNLTYGSILDAMGEAIDNACIVLIFLNEGYSKSDYCLMEAKYATETKVPIIPCMLEENFRARSGLGIIKGDRKHIEFFDDAKFDEGFDELISQINAIESGRTEMRSIVPDDNTDFIERFKPFLTEHVQSTREWLLRQRDLDETQIDEICRRLIEEFSPETLQSLEDNPSNDVDDSHTQEEDNSQRLIQRLLENNERLAEMIRMQQENHARLEQHVINQDEQLFIFQQRQRHVWADFNEHLSSLFRIQQTQQQGQERNDRIAAQLVQQIDRLTELAINQQQQHARQMESMHQLVDRSLQASANTQQQQQQPQYNPSTFHDLIQIIVLLLTLLVLLKNE